MPTRNYTDLEKRLNALTHPHLERQVITTVHDYPIHSLLIGKQTHPTVFLTGGMHGDEPAGVEAVLRFLEQDIAPFLSHYRFFVIPCINPTGYMANTRKNADGKDINRAFDTKETPESHAIKKAIHDYQFVFHLDMHEDYDATGSYFYEGRKDEQWIVPTIAQETLSIGPFNTYEEEGQQDKPLADGVYQVDPKWGLAGLVCYTLAYHTNHVIMPETASTAWDLDRRVAVHLLTLNKLLAHYATQDK